MDDVSDSWLELSDPQTRRPFFANTETGECLWELPDGANLYDLGYMGDDQISYL